MPSPLTHLLTGYAIYRVASRAAPPDAASDTGRRAVVAAAAISLLPDVDTLPGLLHGDPLAHHRSFVHSPLLGLAAALAFAAALHVWRRWSFTRWLVISLVAFELHVLMDFLSVGRGVPWLWPLSHDRFQAPLKLFYGVRWWEGLLSWSHLWTLVNEVAFLGVLFAGIRMWERLRGTAVPRLPR